MPSDYNQLEASRERIKQLERQRRLQENRDKVQQRRMTTRLKIILGGFVLKHLPGAAHFQPKLKQADTNKEFAIFEEFIATIANDERYTLMFPEIVKRKSSAEVKHKS
jgi:hypothetical protein